MKAFIVFSDVARAKNFLCKFEDVLLAEINATQLDQFKDFNLEIYATMGVNYDYCSSMHGYSIKGFYCEYTQFVVTYKDELVDFNSLPQEVRVEIMLAVTEPSKKVEEELIAQVFEGLTG